MPVAPFKLLPHERTVTTLCVTVIGATFAAGLLASVTQAHERPRCRDHRRAAAVVEPAALRAPMPPAVCADAVTGTWLAEEHRPDHGDWIAHELRITPAGDGYRVAHTARVREGDARGHAELDCAPDAVEFDTVGRARLDGDQLHVWGEAIVGERARCTGEMLTYDLDSFTGTLRGDTFDAVNNDGSTARDRPYRFHRVDCEWRRLD